MVNKRRMRQWNLGGCYEEVPGQQSSQTEHEDDEGHGLTAAETKRFLTTPFSFRWNKFSGKRQTHRSAGGLFLILMLMSIFCSKVKSLKINEYIRINSVQDFSHSGFVLWRTEGSFVCGGILLPLKQNKVVKDPRGLAGTCAADSRAANMWWRNTSAAPLHWIYFYLDLLSGQHTFTWIFKSLPEAKDRNTSSSTAS